MTSRKTHIETKKGKMSKSDVWKYFFSSKNFEIKSDLLHDDFMLIEDFSTTAKEDELKMFEDLIDSNWKPSNGVKLIPKKELMIKFT